jgi:DNA-binding FadR family transcriptional regulator
MAHTALANGRHTLSQRLARWLLMSQDRLERNEIPLTHEFLSLMLGVRRPGVTEALHMLEGEHIIKAVRGSITILDREKLERVAADSYGVPEAAYARLIGEPALPARQRTAMITDESSS